MSQSQGHELQYAHVFKGMERKALRVQTLSSSEQWEISIAGSSFSDEVRGNWEREELVSSKCQTRLKNFVHCAASEHRHF